MGIVNAGMLEVYEQIEPELKVLVEDVLLNRRPDATERLVDFGERLKAEAQTPFGNDRQKDQIYMGRCCLFAGNVSNIMQSWSTSAAARSNTQTETTNPC